MNTPSKIRSCADAQEILPRTILKLIRQRRYDKACDQLHCLPRSPLITEIQSVCMMRCGRYDAALGLIRPLALTPGGTTLRPEATESLRINLATALTLKGLPSGGLEILAESTTVPNLTVPNLTVPNLTVPNLTVPSPAAEQLRGAIMKWVSGLSWWRRWDWKINRIDPPRAVVALDFEPGVFPVSIIDVREGIEVDPSRPDSTSVDAGPAPTTSAAPDLAA